MTKTTKSRGLEALLSFAFDRPWMGSCLALLIAVAGLWFGRHIEVKLSLADLLPDQRQSVLDLKAVAKEVGGVGYLAVVVGPVHDDPTSSFPKLKEAVETLPTVRYAYYEREQYLLRKQALYLLPRKDFDDLLKNSETLLNDGKEEGIFDLGLVDDRAEREGRVKASKDFFADFKGRYLQGENGFSRKQRYFISDAGDYALLWVKPAHDSEDLALSKELVDGLRAKVTEVLPAGTPFQLWGRAVNHVADTTQIRNDVAKTSWVGFSVILAILIAGLGGVRSALLTLFIVNIAMGWVVGFAGLFVGRVNIVTSFLLAILGGLGVEYGIHLLRRYYQEKRPGVSRLEAARTTYFQMTRALFSAAMTSAGAFLVLSFSDFRGFSEMGKIAGTGVLSIFLVFVLCFPALIRAVRLEARSFRGAQRFFRFYPFGLRWAWFLLPLVLLFGYGFSKSYFEYDFDRMRALSKRDADLEKLVYRLNGERPATPGAIMASSSDEARKLHAWIEAHLAEYNLHSVLSVANILPGDMAERDRQLQRYRGFLATLSNESIRSRVDIDPQLVRDWIRAKPHADRDLPIQLHDAFGPRQAIVLAYTKDSMSLEQGVRNFDRFLKAAKAEFPDIKVGSDASVFVEILDHINHDGKIVMILFLVGAFFVLWLDFRSLREAAALEAQLILGILLLVALMGLVDVPFSILNIAMVPAVLAGGIDMGVHVRHRQLESGDSALSSARFVAQAVNLGALTSVVGFGSLFLAQAGMLKGIAWISCLGQVSMYFICMFAWPVLRDLYERRVARRRLAPQA